MTIGVVATVVVAAADAEELATADTESTDVDASEELVA